MGILRHGHWRNNTPTKTWRTWRSMRLRCQDPSTGGGYRYGGRGIKVCKRWDVFENFLEDVGEIPEGMTLDRIDNDGNYEPGNVRITSAKVQARNRSSNVYLTVDGETKTVGEWAEITGLPYNTIRNRMKYGWKPDDCVVPSNSTRNVFLTIGGRTQTLTEWAREYGLSKSIISQRLKRGWPHEECLRPSDRTYRVMG